MRPPSPSSKGEGSRDNLHRKQSKLWKVVRKSVKTRDPERLAILAQGLAALLAAVRLLPHWARDATTVQKLGYVLEQAGAARLEYSYYMFGPHSKFVARAMPHLEKAGLICIYKNRVRRSMEFQGPSRLNQRIALTPVGRQLAEECAKDTPWVVEIANRTIARFEDAEFSPTIIAADFKRQMFDQILERGKPIQADPTTMYSALDGSRPFERPSHLLRRLVSNHPGSVGQTDDKLERFRHLVRFGIRSKEKFERSGDKFRLEVQQIHKRFRRLGKSAVEGELCFISGWPIGQAVAAGSATRVVTLSSFPSGGPDYSIDVKMGGTVLTADGTLPESHLYVVGVVHVENHLPAVHAIFAVAVAPLRPLGIAIPSHQEVQDENLAPAPPESRFGSRAAADVADLAGKVLRKYMIQCPAQEKDVQDEFEKVLIGQGIEYTRNRIAIPYAGTSFIPDFALPRLSMAVEVKYCSTPGAEREVVNEINADIPAYAKEFQHQLFIIYDNGAHIRDVDRIRWDIEQNEGVFLRIIKH